jgi:hypothetical protein
VIPLWFHVGDMMRFTKPINYDPLLKHPDMTEKPGWFK